MLHKTYSTRPKISLILIIPIRKKPINKGHVSKTNSTIYLISGGPVFNSWLVIPPATLLAFLSLSSPQALSLALCSGSDSSGPSLLFLGFFFFSSFLLISLLTTTLLGCPDSSGLKGEKNKNEQSEEDSLVSCFCLCKWLLQ